MFVYCWNLVAITELAVLIFAQTKEVNSERRGVEFGISLNKPVRVIRENNFEPAGRYGYENNNRRMFQQNRRLIRSAQINEKFGIVDIDQRTFETYNVRRTNNKVRYDIRNNRLESVARGNRIERTNNFDQFDRQPGKRVRINENGFGNNYALQLNDNNDKDRKNQRLARRNADWWLPMSKAMMNDLNREKIPQHPNSNRLQRSVRKIVEENPRMQRTRKIIEHEQALVDIRFHHILAKHPNRIRILDRLEKSENVKRNRLNTLHSLQTNKQGKLKYSLASIETEHVQQPNLRKSNAIQTLNLSNDRKNCLQRNNERRDARDIRDERIKLEGSDRGKINTFVRKNIYPKYSQISENLKQKCIALFNEYYNLLIQTLFMSFMIMNGMKNKEKFRVRVLQQLRHFPFSWNF